MPATRPAGRGPVPRPPTTPSPGHRCSWRGLLAQRDLPVRDLLDRYELYAYKQWLRVYMRSKAIKHNKDVFEVLGDNFAVLEAAHLLRTVRLCPRYASHRHHRGRALATSPARYTIIKEVRG